MLAASAVDAMLKAKGLKSGVLYARIKQAAEEHLITEDMAEWAHEVRLDANDPRHADDARPHHDTEIAERVVDFAMALAEFLFVLPARVTRGRDAAKQMAGASGAKVASVGGSAGVIAQRRSELLSLINRLLGTIITGGAKGAEPLTS